MESSIRQLVALFFTHHCIFYHKIRITIHVIKAWPQNNRESRSSIQQGAVSRLILYTCRCRSADYKTLACCLSRDQTICVQSYPLQILGSCIIINLDWLKYTLHGYIRLFESSALKSTHNEQWYNERVWMPVDTIFDDIPSIVSEPSVRNPGCFVSLFSSHCRRYLAIKIHLSHQKIGPFNIPKRCNPISHGPPYSGLFWSKCGLSNNIYWIRKANATSWGEEVYLGSALLKSHNSILLLQPVVYNLINETSLRYMLKCY